MRARWLVSCIGMVALYLAVPSPAHAQSTSTLDLGGEMEVGGEGERYLRMLQISGSIPLSAWTLQPFVGAGERALTPSGPHPWSLRFVPADTGARLQLLRPMVRTVLNSTFPVQDAVGPVWAGRGATIVAQGGVMARWHGVRAQLAPIAFLAQNADFPLALNGQQGDAAFGDARFPLSIDFPQRFGDAAYGRVDLGTSSLDLTLKSLAVGVSSAPARWGPAMEYPLLLGPGAGGFLHYYAGTSKPIGLWLFSLQGQLIGGYLSQSDYSTAAVGKERRFASAALVSVSPRGIDGLDIGFARFFEAYEPASLRRALLPVTLAKFVGNSTASGGNEPGENQTASAFFRWAIPKGGVEVYGEWYREDYSGQLRTLALIPDDLSTFTLGIQRAWAPTPSSRRAFRFEIVNGELAQGARYVRSLARPIPPYLHGEVVQGHTQRGLLLGSAEAYGGAGWRASFDSYTPRGRRTFGIERALRFDWLPGQVPTDDLVHPDVLYSLRGELLRFAGAREYGVTIVPSVDLNRNLVAGSDRYNLHAAFTVRGW